MKLSSELDKSENCIYSLNESNMEAPEISFSSEKKKPLKLGNMKYFSANDFSLTESEIKKAHKELQETEEGKITKIKELKNKLESDNENLRYRTDATYLLRFLRVRKYHVGKSYKNIKEGYKFKKKYPEVLDIPPNLEKLLNRNMFVYLPYTDEDGNVLFFFDLEKWKHQEISFKEVVQIINAGSDIISMNPRMQVNGLIGVWDVKELNAYHIASILNNFGIGGFSFYMQNVFPWRVKSLLVLNSGWLSQLFYKMVRPFLSKKISERVILLGSDLEELHQYVNPVLLPKKLGGTLEENEYSITQNILENISYIKYERSFT